MTLKRKALIGAGLYLLIFIAFIAIFGWSRRDNEEYQPQNEFKLDTWIALPGPFDINKAVVFIVIAGLLTTLVVLYVAKRMHDRPNRVQTLVELTFGLMRDNITYGNMDRTLAAKWFPFIGSVFLFIEFSNLIGYIPLPTNSQEKFDLFGAQIPSFGIYAATANVSVPLVLALIVWVSFNVEGIRAKGLGGYLKALVPAGITGVAAVPIFVLEFVSNFMRLLSLTIRLFANILAGHLIILFMTGALSVLLGIEALGLITLPLGIAIYLFEVGLVATLQAFIFATLTAIYLGGAVAEEH